MVVVLFSCEKEEQTKEDQCLLEYKNNYNYICDLRDTGIIDSTEFVELSARCMKEYNECKIN